MYQTLASLATCCAFVLTMGGSLVVPQPAQAAGRLRPLVSTTLSASKTATLTDANNNGKADPGETLTYTIAISNNTGSSASGVTLTDPLDSHTTYVNGSLHASPIAANDSYSTVGNTLLEVGVTPSGYPAVTSSTKLFANDTIATDSFQLKSFQNPSANGGTVSVNSDGSFSYLPPVGFSGTDTFTYTIDNSAATSLQDTATVSIAVSSSKVWYVDDAYTGANGASDGRSSRPFTSLTPLNGAGGSGDADSAGDTIYVSSGNASYTTGLVLENTEALVGSGTALVVNSTTIKAAGTAPTLSTNPITLASGNTLTGFNLSNNGSGAAISGTSVGTLTVSGVQINTTGAALDLTGVSTPSVDVTLTSITSSGGTNNVKLTGLGGTVSLGSGALSGASGDSFVVSGGTAAISYSGTIASGSGHSVNVGSMTGGSVSLSGGVTDTHSGITLAGNTGATISFTGGISANTGASTAFSATGGGTVVATQNNNTIVNTLTTTTATALSVSSTTIGASGLTFRSISSNGANPGISLASTGSSGGLTVTGNGGTCTSAATCTGGTIQGSAGEGINLSSTTSPSFTDMLIETNAADGINGSLVNGLTLSGSTVSGNGTKANVSVENNDGLDFSPNGTGSPNNGLTGTVSITNSTITGSADNNAVISDSSGTLNLTISGSTFSNDQVNDAIHIDANGSTNATVSVTGSTFTNSIGDHFQFSTNSVATGTNSVTFSNNTLSSTVTGVLGGGVVISPDGTSHTSITIDNNTITGDTAGGIGVDDTSVSTASVTGTISGNTVGSPTVAGSGSSQADDIGIAADGSATETLAITNNHLYQYENVAGIHVLNREGSPTQNLTITGNTIADPGSTALSGLYVDVAPATTDSGKLCAAIGGAGSLANSMTGSAPSAAQGGIADFVLLKKNGGTIELPGYTGGPTDTTAVVSFVAGNNISGGTPTGFAQATGTGSYVGGTACTQPPAMAALAADSTMTPAGRHATSSTKRAVARTNRVGAKPTAHRRAAPRHTRAFRHQTTGVSNGTVEVDVGTLPAGKTETIEFQVTINNRPIWTRQVPR